MGDLLNYTQTDAESKKERHYRNDCAPLNLSAPSMGNNSAVESPLHFYIAQFVQTSLQNTHFIVSFKKNILPSV